MDTAGTVRFRMRSNAEKTANCLLKALEESVATPFLFSQTPQRKRWLQHWQSIFCCLPHWANRTNGFADESQVLRFRDDRTNRARGRLWRVENLDDKTDGQLTVPSRIGLNSGTCNPPSASEKLFLWPALSSQFISAM
jgi:hypothetical protein